MTDTYLDSIVAALGELLNEHEPDVLVKLRAVVEQVGVEGAAELRREVIAIRGKWWRDEPLTSGEWWVARRADGQPRTIGGSFLAAAKRQQDRAAKLARAIAHAESQTPEARQRQRRKAKAAAKEAKAGSAGGGGRSDATAPRPAPPMTNPAPKASRVASARTLPVIEQKQRRS